MELSKQESNMIKGIVTLSLVFLHLFNTKDYINQFQPTLTIGGLPLYIIYL